MPLLRPKRKAPKCQNQAQGSSYQCPRESLSMVSIVSKIIQSGREITQPPHDLVSQSQSQVASHARSSHRPFKGYLTGMATAFYPFPPGPKGVMTHRMRVTKEQSWKSLEGS